MLRKKKKKPLKLLTKTKQMLHSNSKSTYFYKQWSSWSNACHNIFANGFRWSSRHCEQNSSGFRLRDGANPTRSSLTLKNPYSKNAYGRLGFLKSYILPGVCVLALLLVLGLSINPISTQDNHQAFAETNIDAHSGDIVPENGVALRIDTALNDKDTIEKQVSGSGTQYIKVDFTVGANNVQNYDVYVQADSTALTGQSHGDKLQSITTDSTGTVGTKQWGYGVSRGSVEPSTMTYRPIQTNVSTSADGQDAGEGKTLTGISQPYTLAFAANLEGAAADHYKSNITLSVAVGAEETVKNGLGFNGITEMQQMTSSICNSAPAGLEGRLKDTRDNKVYWIAKLKDNNCWMTQNLAYNGSGSQTLPGSWRGNDSLAQFYNPGLFIYTTPNIVNNCGDESTELGDCTEKGWLHLDDVLMLGTVPETWTETDSAGFYRASSYIAADGITVCNKESGSYFGDIASDYIPCRIYSSEYVNVLHYASGNYYSWISATDGTGASVTTNGANASGSVCPNGWKLPQNSGNKSFKSLFLAYGSAVDGVLFGEQDVRLAPLYLVYGGRPYMFSSSRSNIIDVGESGYYWTSTSIYNGTGAYNMFFSYPASSSPSQDSTSSRYVGYSVRCVAR